MRAFRIEKRKRGYGFVEFNDGLHSAFTEALLVTDDDVKNNREVLEVVAYERNRDKKYDEEDSEEPVDGKKEEQKTPEPDPIRNEAVRIISDLIDFSGLGKTASTNKADVAPVESKP